jgi:hypothetical protein
MKLYVMPIQKHKLDRIPGAEKAFYIHVGHLRNELMVLTKFLKWSINKPSDNPILIDVQVAQTFLISRMLAGKVWEGWQLLKRCYVGAVRIAIEGSLPEKPRDAFQALEEYFATKKNLINMVRNRFAFHYDPSRIEKQLTAVNESDKLTIYIGEKEANVFYQMSETIAAKAMLDAIQPGDFQGANAKLMKQVTEISLCLVRFCDGCLMLMTDSYFGRDRQSLNPEEIELPNPPSRNEIEVPFFSE